MFSSSLDRRSAVIVHQKDILKKNSPHYRIPNPPSAVALLIPFLPQYYTLLPFSPSTLEYISSLYSISQILGAFCLGKAADVSSNRQRKILENGWLSSSISYSTVFFAVTTHLNPNISMFLICFSRVLVGFPKT